VKVTVVVDEAGKVVAAHIPTAPPDDYEGDEPPMIEFVPSEGEEVVELDIPDEDVASDPEPEVLEISSDTKTGAPGLEGEGLAELRAVLLQEHTWRQRQGL
jgi:hypothetical protein